MEALGGVPRAVLLFRVSVRAAAHEPGLACRGIWSWEEDGDGLGGSGDALLLLLLLLLLPPPPLLLLAALEESGQDLDDDDHGYRLPAGNWPGFPAVSHSFARPARSAAGVDLPLLPRGQGRGGITHTEGPGDEPPCDPGR